MQIRKMKYIVIIGATSGIGLEVAKIYIQQGWKVGIAGRRISELEALQCVAPAQVELQVLDVMQEDAAEKMNQLINRLGGMDLFFLSSGIGKQNPSLQSEIEILTARTNVEGFIRMTTAAYRYFASEKRVGHIAVISSVAGTKGLGIAPAYSATKRFQNTYIQALAQLARMEQVKVSFTDIRPGFVATALLKDDRYPLLMQTDKVARLIVKALNRQKRVAIIDWRYALIVFFWQLLPNFLWERLRVRN